MQQFVQCYLYVDIARIVMQYAHNTTPNLLRRPLGSQIRLAIRRNTLRMSAVDIVRMYDYIERELMSMDDTQVANLRLNRFNGLCKQAKKSNVDGYHSKMLESLKPLNVPPRAVAFAPFGADRREWMTYVVNTTLNMAEKTARLPLQPELAHLYDRDTPLTKFDQVGPVSARALGTTFEGMMRFACLRRPKRLNRKLWLRVLQCQGRAPLPPLPSSSFSSASSVSSSCSCSSP